MRIDEIASAEDQIALFKLITDKVWQALGDQQRADADAKAAEPLKAKLKLPDAKRAVPQTVYPATKHVARAASQAKPKTIPIRSQPFNQQPKATQAHSIKQNLARSQSNDPLSRNLKDFDKEKINIMSDKDRHN